MRRARRARSVRSSLLCRRPSQLADVSHGLDVLDGVGQALGGGGTELGRNEALELRLQRLALLAEIGPRHAGIVRCLERSAIVELDRHLCERMLPVRLEIDRYL